MASGVEGVLTLSIGVGVSPEPGAIELLRRYRLALNYAINKIISLNLKTIKEAHRELYRELIEWFGLPSRIPGGALAPLTAPQMTDVNPNRWGEPMNRPEGTLAPRAGRRSDRCPAVMLKAYTPIYRFTFSMISTAVGKSEDIQNLPKTSLGGGRIILD